MTTQSKKQVAKAFREVADKIDPPVNKISKPPKPSTSEAAQEAHEAALASHRTKIERGIRQSLNSATTPAEAEALLKQLEQKQRKKD